jgi:hypothetical protein
MPASRAKYSQDEDDVVGLAGWLFTDLLLGLVIVFLATASFQVFGNTGEVTCSEYEKTYFPVPLLARYTDETEAGNQIKNKMDAFARKNFGEENNLGNYKVAVALVYGYYEPGNQQAGDGQRFAFRFYMNSLRKTQPDYFPNVKGPSLNETEDTNVRFYGAPPDNEGKRVPNRGVYIELFFIYDTCAIGTGA